MTRRRPPGAPEATSTGWRAWGVYADGRLWSGGLEKDAIRANRTTWDCYSATPTGCHIPTDYDNMPFTKEIVAVSKQPHDPPGPNCSCGLRILAKLTQVLDYVALIQSERGGPERNGIPVIGRVEGWGSTEPGIAGDDPPGALRVKYARVGPVIYLARYAAQHVDAIHRRHPGVEIHIGTRPGLGWLDEIAEAEGVTPTHRTYLGRLRPATLSELIGVRAFPWKGLTA